MIYIRAEMWPKGDRTKARILGEATIENLGGGTRTKADYRTCISKRGGFKPTKEPLTKGLVQRLLGDAPSNSLDFVGHVIEAMTPKDPEAWRVHRPTASSIWKEIKVEGFPRASRNIWDLLFRSLRMGVGERNEKKP